MFFRKAIFKVGLSPFEIIQPGNPIKNGRERIATQIFPDGEKVSRISFY
jgi:hypothetical protein